MKKSLFLIASFVMCSSVFAQWTKPVPAAQEMKLDEVCYMYNVEAGGFLLGANDWQTRASYDPTKGYKIKIKEALENMEDPTSAKLGTYWICDSVEKYHDAKQTPEWRAMFVDGTNAYVDNVKGACVDQWIIESVGENVYTIKNKGIAEGEQLFGAAETYEGKTGNTRLWFYDTSITYEGTVDNEPATLPKMGGQFYSKWIFVSPEEYESFAVKQNTYSAAIALNDYITSKSAEYPTVDFSSMKAVYENTSSTLEELTAALRAAKQAVSDYRSGLCSVENPGIFTDMITNAGFEDGSLNGWTNSGEKSTQTHTNKAFDNVQGDIYCESWHVAGTFNMNQTLTDLPAGIYKLSAYAYDSNNSANIYLGDAKSEKVTESKLYTVWTYLDGTKDEIKVGFTFQGTSSSWTCVDDFQLIYYGNTVEASKFMFEELNKSYKETIDAAIENDEPYYLNAKASYDSLMAKVENATSIDENLKYCDELPVKAAAFSNSITAYKNLLKYIEACKNEISVGGYSSDLISAIKDFILNEDADETEECIKDLKDEYDVDSILTVIDECPIILCSSKNGDAYKEGVSCSKSAEEIEAYQKAFDIMYRYAIKNALSEGQKCTNLLTNPKFTDANGAGWTTNVTPTNWKWTGGLIPGFPVAESWHSYFDISQTIEVPNGIYSISLNGFCRLDNANETEVPAEIYLNDFSTKLMNIKEDVVSGEDVKDGINCYLTNGTSGAWTNNEVFKNSTRNSPADNTDSGDAENGYYPNGMEGASVAFSAGRYKATAYGLVENGKITVGIRNSKSNQVWALWSNFELVYEGKSLKALNNILPMFTNNLKEYFNNNKSNMTDTLAITSIIENAEKSIKEKNSEEMYANISKVRDGILAAEANVKAKKAFDEINGLVESTAQNNEETAMESALAAYEAYTNSVGNISKLSTAELDSLTKVGKALITTLCIPNNYTSATAEKPTDMSAVLDNNEYLFDSSIIWEGDKPAIDKTNAVAEFFNKNYDYYETIKGLPAGYYALSLTGFYRQGEYADDYRKVVTEGIDTCYNSFLYLKTDKNEAKTALKSLCEGRISVEEAELMTSNMGKVGYDEAVPNDMKGGSLWFEIENSVYAQNKVIIKLEEGETLRAGIRKEVLITNDWTLFTNWKLEYLGTETPTAIDTTEINVSNAPVGIYTISGTRSSSFVNGFNIVKMSDGSVKKYLKK